MEFILNNFIFAVSKVWETFVHNWPFLLFSIIIATSLKLYVDLNKVAGWLNKYKQAGVAGATLVAVTTPLCSCGTTALILGMLASAMPWAPIVAFMVSSPLTSPEELVYSAGLFGWPFALAFFIASSVLGFAGGGLAAFFEKQGWLKNQLRYNLGSTNETAAPAAPPVATAVPAERRYKIIRIGDADIEPATPKASSSCGCGAVPEKPSPAACSCSPVQQPPATACGCSTSRQPAPAGTCDCNSADKSSAPHTKPPVTLKTFLYELWQNGYHLVLMFAGFAFVGYFLNGLIPPEWVPNLFGSGHVYSVPLAATLGLPFYINTEASLPLVRAMLDSGMSQGAALAFLIAGAGTSIGAIAGALTIARWKVVSLVVGVLWVGAILSGYLFDLCHTLGWI